MKKQFFVCCCLVLSVLLLTATARATETTVLTGKVRTTVTREPVVPFNGVVDSVLVSPGDKVTRGQPILRYTLQDEARRDLQREVNLGAHTETSRAQIVELQSQLASLEAQRNRARSLAASGLGSDKTLGRLQGDVKALESRIALLQASVSKVEDNFALRLEELSNYFDTEVTAGMHLPEFLYLKSPIDGYVLSVSENTNPGATFAAGYKPVSIGQMDPMVIQVPVYEAEVSSLKVGDEARVEIPSLNDKVFTATISEIAWVSTDMDVSRASYFNVELTIPNPDLLLKPGFKAVVRFTLN